jgi:flagellar motor switch protein FliN/FliY
LGHRLLSAKSRASDHEHHAIHATSHLIGQLTASLATTLSDKLKTAVGSAESLNAGEISASAYTFAVAFREMEQDPEFLFIRPSSELLCLLDSASSISVVSDPSASPSTTRNLELLLDVEMPVSISLGSTRLLLKDIAQLSTGSIIELNRSISEPVQLVVNNFPIARADVVVVDGKFGVRIKEIVSRHDRLRSLT